MAEIKIKRGCFLFGEEVISGNHQKKLLIRGQSERGNSSAMRTVLLTVYLPLPIDISCTLLPDYLITASLQSLMDYGVDLRLVNFQAKNDFLY